MRARLACSDINASETSTLTLDESWTLTCQISPRPRVRIAALDGDTVTSSYPTQRALSLPAPDTPWAVYLADANHRFRFLTFDLDAKNGTSSREAHRDATRVADLLADAGLPAVVCQSGPSGGRHVWAALAEGVSSAIVGQLARLMKHLCPTLDTAPLMNPATGCVRPPGAPHRAGGQSAVIQGTLDDLLQPVARATDVATLLETLAELVTNTTPVPRLTGQADLPVDEDGRPYIVGIRRNLPPASQAALQATPAAEDDASAWLWKIVLGAASARWRFSDLEALLDTAPGLENARTKREGATRRRRSPQEMRKLLAWNWDKAVRQVAVTPRRLGDDLAFEQRAAHTTALIHGLQSRADASLGRWNKGGGPADRRVLDVLCVLALQACSSTIEADTRRLAIHAGIGRETARVALIRLAEDSWIVQEQPATGARGAQWRIDPHAVIHIDTEITWSQGRKPAGGAPTPCSADRLLLLSTLTSRTAAFAHDVFTSRTPALGIQLGNVFARLSPGAPLALTDAAREVTLDGESTYDALTRLVAAGLVIRTDSGWQRSRNDRRERLAHTLNVEGRLERRRALYRLERDLWAWANAEITWMQTPRRAPARTRPGFGQLTLLPETVRTWPTHPRNHQRRLDWREARRMLMQLPEQESTAA